MCVRVLLILECLHVCVRVCNHGMFCRSAAQAFSFTLCQFSESLLNKEYMRRV